MGRLSVGTGVVVCVGWYESKLAEWVLHVRALCFDGSDIFESRSTFILFQRWLPLHFDKWCKFQTDWILLFYH